MALASSGLMSIGGIATNRSINLELGEAQNATSGMGNSNLRTLAGVASGSISMSDFYGASAGSCTSFTSSTVGISSTAACAQAVASTFYHNGNNSFPIVGDDVYSNSSCSIALQNGYYKMGTGNWILVNIGTVTQSAACRR